MSNLTRNDPLVIDNLLELLFKARAVAQAIEENIQEGDPPLSRVHHQMFDIELEAIATILQRCVNSSYACPMTKPPGLTS